MLSGPADADKVLEVQGFIFYVEGYDAHPGLMVMKTYNLTSKTVGQIEDVPVDLLKGAIARPGAKHVGGMYPIDDPLEKWIKGKLGLS